MTNEFYEDLKKSAGYDKKNRLRGYLWKVYDNRTGMGEVVRYFWSKDNAKRLAEQDYTSNVYISRFNMRDCEQAELYVTRVIDDLYGASLINLL